MGSEWGPVAPWTESAGGRQARWAMTRQADKLYQKPIDFMPVDGQSVQS
jgi:hypothetical protein